MDIADPRDLQTVLRRHGVRAATSLGQRFLVDRSVLKDIVDAAELSAEDDVLEVGPGPGVLTTQLAERVRSVTAVEIDERMIRVLRDTLSAHQNITIVRADALEVDLFALAERRPTRIVANVPYQITTPLLERFIGDDRRPSLIVVLVQEEVARRIVATASSGKERGYLSVFVQSFADARIVRRVPARAFRPAPKVGSAVVALRTHPRPAFAPLERHAFLRFVSDVFRHRRKQLRGALGHEAGVTPDRAEAALRACGIDPKRRPEELTLSEWVALAGALGVPTGSLVGAAVTRAVTLLAPAKINLALAVTGTRDDGYHELRSVLATIDLADRVRVGPHRSLEVRIAPDVGAPPGEDLASRAVRAMATATGHESVAFVHIRKRVPVFAGLGGGSSDAGAVLRALASIWKRGDVDLVSLAATIGSDVPFFATGARVAFVGGRGERVDPLPDPAATHVVIVRSHARLATKDVFAELKTADRGAATAVEMLRDAFARGGVTPRLLRDNARNDLLGPAARLCPAIAYARSRAAERGIALALSGSGPTLFAVADDRRDALRMARILRRLGLLAHAHTMAG